MKTSIKRLEGNWHQGFALDKHSVSSTFTGYSQSGRRQYDTLRTEVGEAIFQLKYRGNSSKAQTLAQQLADSIYSRFTSVGFLVPMPASRPRVHQPVTEVAHALGGIVQVPVFEGLLVKTHNGQSLKDLNTKEEKMTALAGSFSINDQISTEGQWNVLLIDDLFHTGASAEAACTALASYRKVGQIYFAALTWR